MVIPKHAGQLPRNDPKLAIAWLAREEKSRKTKAGDETIRTLYLLQDNGEEFLTLLEEYRSV